jgi:flavin-binding protein dodecin
MMQTGDSMYEVNADTSQNRLYLDLEGSFDADTLDEAADDTIAEAQKLTVGFDIINDLTGFRPVSPEAAQAIQRAQEEMKQMGLDRVIRVVDEDTSQVVINAFERRSQKAGYSGETADRVEEAEQLLLEDSQTGYSYGRS